MTPNPPANPRKNGNPHRSPVPLLRLPIPDEDPVPDRYGPDLSFTRSLAPTAVPPKIVPKFKRTEAPEGRLAFRFYNLADRGFIASAAFRTPMAQNARFAATLDFSRPLPNTVAYVEQHLGTKAAILPIICAKLIAGIPMMQRIFVVWRRNMRIWEGEERCTLTMREYFQSCDAPRGTWALMKPFFDALLPVQAWRQMEVETVSRRMKKRVAHVPFRMRLFWL